MKKLLVIAFLLSVIFAAVPVEEDGVLVLTEENFDETVNEAELILVEFYAPWCGHCKSLAPEYAAAAKILKPQNILLAKVDATIHSEVSNRFDVKSYPTLKGFRKGNVFDYNGPRQKDGIVSYMELQNGPSSKPIETAEALKNFLNHRDVSLVGFFPKKSGEVYKNYLEVADKLREEFKIAQVIDEAIRKENGFENEAIVLFTHEKGAEKKVYNGAHNKNALSDWVYANSVPLVGEITSENDNRYKKKNLPIVKLYFDVDFGSNLKRTNYFINRLKKAAEGDTQNKLSFVVAKKSDYKDELTKLGLEDKEVALGIDDFNRNLRYRLEGEVNQENIKKFVSDYLNGNLESFIKSAPIPEKNDDPVSVVVGKTFNDIVLDPTKDVLIELYAPWCGHCKKLEPIYTELGEKIKKEGISNVVIAKMDATVNDSPSPNIQAKGYPTIYFVPANKKDSPISYPGERNVKAMYDFVKKNASAWKKKDEL